MKMTTVNHCQV